MTTDASAEPVVLTGSKFSQATRRNIEKSQARRDMFLQALIAAHGYTADAREASGVGVKTIEYWRREFPEFKARMNMIVADCQARAGVGPTRRLESRTFEDFRLRYFARHTYAHQSQLVEILDSVKPREIVLVLLHPEAGKTATMEDWLCKKIGENPDIRVSYLCESQDLAKKVLGFIKGRMTEPDWIDYQAAYGPFYQDGQERSGKPWTTSYITVHKSTHKERDYTLQTRAVTSRTYGSRIDLLIGDDIQSRETYTQTEKIFAHLRQTYFTRGKKMTMVFVGTRIGPGDIYERMMDAGLIDHLVTMVAADGDTPKVPEAWAEREDHEDEASFLEEAKTNLAKIRHHVGPDVWWASYQQNPRTTELASFTEFDAAKDWGREIGGVPSGLVYLTLDPALSGMNALMALHFTPDELRVLDCQTDTRLGEVEAILNRIREMATKYRPAFLVVEKNAFQQALANDFRLAGLSQQCGFTIRTHETGKNKHDPIFGVGSMASSFNAGHIRIPWAEGVTRTRLQPLITQLENWRPNVPTKFIQQDAVMALWFGWMHWRNWKDALSKQNRQVPMKRPTWLRSLVAPRI